MNSFKRFNEEKLPARKYFYSSIKDRKIGDYDTFEMKNMGDYHDHYLKKDLSLLADVFEKFINAC